MSADVLKAVPYLNLQAGLDICAKRWVNTLHIGAEIITATVNGKRPYAVQVDLGAFAKRSYCTCEEVGLCPHIAAVFLEAYKRCGGDVAGLLERAATANRAGKPGAARQAAGGQKSATPGEVPASQKPV
ncbi:MAG: SWIM zinc finger family protein, partial [Alicyclobacillus sp.]|nr:SWIM zinc finger family protein [Alicyclobacillus sp.]